MTYSQGGQPGDLIGVEEACGLLEVSPDQVQVMIDGGLLNPVGGPGELRFNRGDVIAARELGG